MWKASFWMRKFGAFSLKRLWCWSPSVVVGELNLGPLTRKEKQGCIPTVTYSKHKKTGVKKYSGNKNLKLSQSPIFAWNLYFKYLWSSAFNFKLPCMPWVCESGTLFRDNPAIRRQYPWPFAFKVVELLPRLADRLWDLPED